jgi:cytochrome c peroxidase
MNINAFCAAFCVFGILPLASLSGCESQSAPLVPTPSEKLTTGTSTPTSSLVLARSIFQPLAPSQPANANVVELGRMLYYDTRLSRSGTLSCNSCHSLSHYGVDNQSTSVGFRGQHGGRNSPSVYNAALHVAQFWDGRAKTVEEQAKGPVLNPVEMAMASSEDVGRRLARVPEYRRRFAAAFPGQKNPVSLDNAAISIGAFERGLVTPSRLDRFLEGDEEALTSREQDGLRTFVEVGCASCHSGVGLGGNQYQKFGLKHPVVSKDPGRFQVTKDPHDRGVFKVPSLRNVTRTGPYFHDGSVESLDKAIRLMAHHQLDAELGADEVQRIRDFLLTAEGEIPEDYIRVPQLPGEP